MKVVLILLLLGGFTGFIISLVGTTPPFGVSTDAWKMFELSTILFLIVVTIAGISYFIISVRSGKWWTTRYVLFGAGPKSEKAELKEK